MISKPQCRPDSVFVNNSYGTEIEADSIFGFMYIARQFTTLMIGFSASYREAAHQAHGIGPMAAAVLRETMALLRTEIGITVNPPMGELNCANTCKDHLWTIPEDGMTLNAILLMIIIGNFRLFVVRFKGCSVLLRFLQQVLFVDRLSKHGILYGFLSETRKHHNNKFKTNASTPSNRLHMCHLVTRFLRYVWRNVVFFVFAGAARAWYTGGQTK